MSHRFGSKFLLALQFDGVHLAVNERASSLPRRLFAVLFCQQAVLSGQHTLLGGLAALPHAALALLGGPHEDLGAGECAHAVLSRIGGTGLRHRDIARDRGLVSRERCDIAILGDRIALLAGSQSRLGAVIALACGLLALVRSALANVLTDAVLLAVTAGREILIAGDLIAIGSQLVAISARLVAVSAGLVDIRQRLVAVRPRLVAIRERLSAISKRVRVLEYPRIRGAVLRWSVRTAEGTISWR